MAPDAALDRACHPRPAGPVFPLSEADGGAMRHAVFVIEDGRARDMPVGVGARNGRHARIQQDLRVGQLVIVYRPPGLPDAVRVGQAFTDDAHEVFARRDVAGVADHPSQHGSGAGYARAGSDSVRR